MEMVKHILCLDDHGLADPLVDSAGHMLANSIFDCWRNDHSEPRESQEPDWSWASAGWSPSIQGAQRLCGHTVVDPLRLQTGYDTEVEPVVWDANFPD